ncbi:MAG: hypothetical protein K2Y01_03580 [Rhabdochlamydiaceae bacterium]|nr:hypothetical protein [Rhabdochlamydiaceae bacterium]
MAQTDNSFTLEEIGKALQLKFPELGSLVRSLKNLSQYDFLRFTSMNIIPLIQKGKPFKSLISRWEKETLSVKQELENLKQEALQEVTAALTLLISRVKESEHLSAIPQVQQSLDEAREYLEGTRPVYIPSHFEMAADTMASTCRLLLKHNAAHVLTGIAQLVDLNDNIDIPAIEKLHFYKSITKMTKKNQEWSWETYHFPHTCWSYLKLTAELWNLKESAFAEKSLKSSSIEECKESGELLGLHNYWVELQSIRNHRQDRTPFFTIERFTKYLQVICSELLLLKSKNASEAPSLGIVSLCLKIDGDHLLLLIEKGDRTKTAYVLHKFKGVTGPYSFFKYLIDNPRKDADPSDFGMQSNSPSNLLPRSQFKGPLQTLFFQPGTKKNSIQLISPLVPLKDQPLSLRLSIEQQLAEMHLSSYDSTFTNTIGPCE